MKGPAEYDVVCGRGRATFMHPGNKRFRAIIGEHIKEYSQAACRFEKSVVVSNICKVVRKSGEFVTPNGDKVSERMAREKVGQGLRDYLSSQYKSSTQAKQMRRKNDLMEQSVLVDEMIGSNAQIGSILGRLHTNLHSPGLSDSSVEAMFNNANSQILQELKDSNLMLPNSSRDAPSPVPSPTPEPEPTNEAFEPEPLSNLLHTVVHEDEEVIRYARHLGIVNSVRGV